MVVTEKERAIKYLATELEMTDKEIGKLFEVTRSTISHYRRNHGIFKHEKLGRKGELAAIRRLNKLGFKTLDMNLKDKGAPYDILVNDEIRIEVKTATLNEDRYLFSLTDKPGNGNVESNTRIRLTCGRTRKLYEKTADYFILVGVDIDGLDFWIIPTNEIDKHLYSISCPLTKGKYGRYKNNFALLRGDMND